MVIEPFCILPGLFFSEFRVQDFTPNIATLQLGANIGVRGRGMLAAHTKQIQVALFGQFFFSSKTTWFLGQH